MCEGIARSPNKKRNTSRSPLSLFFTHHRLTRITSFFSTREVGVVTHGDDGKLAAAVETLRG